MKRITKLTSSVIICIAFCLTLSASANAKNTTVRVKNLSVEIDYSSKWELATRDSLNKTMMKDAGLDEAQMRDYLLNYDIYLWMKGKASDTEIQLTANTDSFSRAVGDYSSLSEQAFAQEITKFKESLAKLPLYTIKSAESYSSEAIRYIKICLTDTQGKDYGINYITVSGGCLYSVSLISLDDGIPAFASKDTESIAKALSAALSSPGENTVVETPSIAASTTKADEIGIIDITPETYTSFVAITDAAGEPVTDANGAVMSAVVVETKNQETEIVYGTDGNGEQVSEVKVTETDSGTFTKDKIILVCIAAAVVLVAIIVIIIKLKRPEKKEAENKGE